MFDLAEAMQMSREGSGRVWIDPVNPPERKFSAQLIRGENSRFEEFPTREAAHEWLAAIQADVAERCLARDDAVPDTPHKLRIKVSLRSAEADIQKPEGAGLVEPDVPVVEAVAAAEREPEVAPGVGHRLRIFVAIRSHPENRKKA